MYNIICNIDSFIREVFSKRICDVNHFRVEKMVHIQTVNVKIYHQQVSCHSNIAETYH